MKARRAIIEASGLVRTASDRNTDEARNLLSNKQFRKAKVVKRNNGVSIPSGIVLERLRINMSEANADNLLPKNTFETLKNRADERASNTMFTKETTLGVDTLGNKYFINAHTKVKSGVVAPRTLSPTL